MIIEDITEMCFYLFIISHRTSYIDASISTTPTTPTTPTTTTTIRPPGTTNTITTVTAPSTTTPGRNYFCYRLSE